MIVIELTEAQKDLIHGEEYAPDSIFNCVQDINDNWVVSLEEMISLENTDYYWLYNLPMKVHEPKPYNFIP